MRPSIPRAIWSAHPVERNSNARGASAPCITDRPIKPHTVCRACGHSGLESYLDLGSQAPANALRHWDATFPEFTAPLSVAWCPACGLSQLEQVIAPSILYAHYPFRAGISRLWQAHCAMLMTSLDSPGRKFLLDIGSNDGTLLSQASERSWKVLGIDPDPIGNGPSLAGLWSSGMARRVARIHGQADVVTATNVFGHVDDAKDFLDGIAMVLKAHGLAIIECPHILPLLENVAFDTIYHEHLSYWSLLPLKHLAGTVGLKVIDVQSFPELHGGTVRYILAPTESRATIKASVGELVALEEAHFERGIEPYLEFANHVRAHIVDAIQMLLDAKEAGQRIWGYGANAKGAVFLQALNLPSGTFDVIVDDTQAKWGLRMPGSHVRITSPGPMHMADIVVLLSWNNADALKAESRKYGFRGRFFLRHPTPHFEDT